MYINRVSNYLKSWGDEIRMRLEALIPLSIAFVVVTVVLSMGSDVVSDIRDDQTANSYAYNVSSNGLTGLSNISGKLGTIGLVLAIAVIIGIIVTYMSFR